MHIRLVVVLCLLTLLNACATVEPKPQEKPLVAYEGETLVVAGKRYERSTEHYPCRGGMCSPASPLARYKVGSILVQVNTSEEHQVKDLISRYELPVSEQIGSGKHGFFTLVIAVPTFFEEQWVEVLRNETGIIGAWTVQFAYILPP